MIALRGLAAIIDDTRPRRWKNLLVPRPSAWLIPVGALVWLLAPLLLGFGLSGVRIDQQWASGDLPARGELPQCVVVHEYGDRHWFAWKTISHDVRVQGCADASGHLALSGPLACTASSGVGPGRATCTARPSGDGIRVDVHLAYPFPVGLLAVDPRTYAFVISRTGNYQAVATMGAG